MEVKREELENNVESEEKRDWVIKEREGRSMWMHSQLIMNIMNASKGDVSELHRRMSIHKEQLFVDTHGN